jgi:hypothetical protein
MTSRKRKWFFIGLAFAVVLFLLFIFLKPTHARPVPSLLSRTLRFDAALLDAAWKKIAVDKSVSQVFLRARVNRYFPDQAVNCRVNYNGVSFQALLAPAGSRIELALKADKGDQLSFSIFNPQAKTMKFMVKIGAPGKERLLFSDFIRENISAIKKVFLRKAGKQAVRLVLETEGEGIGAWINPCQLSSRTRPRTVVILVLDTLRADHVSAYGYQRRTTPTLEKLAASSLLFRRAFSSSSWTLPAHVSLFSGRDVLTHGVVSHEAKIPADLPLLAETMQADGFVTLAQTGGGFVNDSYGFYRGFQTYVNNDNSLFQSDAAGLLYNSFLEDMAAFADQDVFFFLHTYQMHIPYKAPDSYFQTFNPALDIKILNIHSDLKSLDGMSAPLTAAQATERQQLIDLYDASILYSDQELLKPLIAYLHACKRFDDALLIVMSDHGEEFYDHGRWNHGHSLYQELTRIPLVIKLPGQRQGEIRDRLVSICDIYDLVKGQYGLAEKNSPLLGHAAGDAQRILELSLPVITLPYKSPGKVSFVENEYQYIHNFQPPAAQGGPAPSPALKSDEWFSVASSPGTPGAPFSPSLAFISRYKGLLGGYILRLKTLKKNVNKLDPRLIQNLKALGYLNN